MKKRISFTRMGVNYDLTKFIFMNYIKTFRACDKEERQKYFSVRCTMKRKIYLMMISLLLFSATFCSDNIIEPIQYDPNAMRVAGNYIATTFVVPGSNDGSVDVLANGGMISAILLLDFTVRGRMIMPSHPNLQGEGFDEMFEGIFTVKKDSLQFKNTDNYLSHPQLYFVIKNRKLEGKLEGISSTIIVLEKQN